MKIIHTHCSPQPTRSPVSLPKKARALLGGAAWLSIGLATIHAQNWETIDDISPRSGADSIVADASGNLFVGGSMRDAKGRFAVLLKSSDGGETWDSDPSTPDVAEPADSIASAYNYSSWFEALAARQVGSENHVVAAAKYLMPQDSTGASRCAIIIRRSTDGGLTWTTADSYRHPTYQIGIQAEGSGWVAIDGSGNIYYAVMGTQQIATKKGKTTTYSYVNHWLIRKGVPAANGTFTWTTSDLPFPTAHEYNRTNVSPSAVACVGSNVYVVGGGGSEGVYWRVIKSSNGGSAWAVADDYRFATNNFSHARSITADASGNLYVAGLGASTVQNTHKTHWIVRKGLPGGTAWNTIDQFQGANSGNAGAWSVATTPAGAVHVTGWMAGNRWVTRERAAGAATFTTVDDYVHEIRGNGRSTGITVDALGNVFASGYAADPATNFIEHWITRRKLAPAP